MNSRFIDKKNNSFILPEVLILGKSEIEEFPSMGGTMKVVEILLGSKPKVKLLCPPSYI